MKTLINYNHFLKAVEYVDQQFFSKPYSITPIIDRWFNQLAMIELADGRLVNLNNKIALKHVDIILDDKVVAKHDRALLFKFHSQDSEFEKERATLDEKIQALTDTLKESSIEITTKQNEELKELEAQLIQFDADKIKANALFEAIIKTGKTALNEQALEATYGSKIKNIIYKPNHGLTHSVRVALYINTIHTFRQQYQSERKELTETELEKLQFMMLFSVVGRRDETGFNDTKGRPIYQGFRATSGQEYRNYAQQELTHLYGKDIEQLYRDAIIVELMGYSTIAESITKRTEPPALFIAYVIEKEQMLNRQISREQALTLINQNKYTMDDLFSVGPVRALADAKLLMMNKAHALDLTRCYPLYPLTEGGAQSLTVLNDYLNLSGFYSSADSEKMESAFKIMRFSFDTFALTGQNSTFGLLSTEEFQAQKEAIVLEIQKIKDQFTAPISPQNKVLLLEQAKKQEKEIKQYWVLTEQDETQLLNSYCKVLILKQIATRLTAANKLNPHKNMFQFQHAATDNPHQVDHHKNTVSLLNALQTLTPIPGVSQVTFPLISAVLHDRNNNTVTVTFDEPQQAELFKETYSILFNVSLFSTQNTTGQNLITVNRTHYLKLLNDKLIEFKKVTIPEEINRESSLIDDNGGIEAINLIAGSRGLVRLVSTTPLGGEHFPDYDYFLRALENPIEERYTPPLKEFENFPVESKHYYDPRNADGYTRDRNPNESPDVRFQEPVLKPSKIANKLADGWTLGKPGRQKNTIFTKKLSHSLLPPHGKVHPFTGYPGKKIHYFPIGVLSDLNQVDVKDERYVWAESMDTFVKIWIRDTSFLIKKFYTLLNATLDNTGNPLRTTQTNHVTLDKSKLQQPSTPAVLIEYLKNNQKTLIKKLDNKFFRPTEKAIQDFKLLLNQEKREYLKQVANSPESQKQIEELYQVLDQRLNQEAKRNHPKYAITIKELIKQQKETQGVGSSSEILACNTKEAVRALYASKDVLFDRLNLAYHAMQIKKKFRYQVPLLVLSDNKPPYHYTEAMIKADLKNAYQLLQEDKFPYDRTLEVAYVLGPDGSPLFDKGKPVYKRAADNRLVYEPKDLNYQQDLLVNLFQMGLPEITQLKQLSRINIQGIDSAIEVIVQKMDVLGGLARETELMEEQFTNQRDVAKKEAFFLREVALGHVSLLKEMLDNKCFKLTLPLCNKALLFAQNKKDPVLDAFLLSQHEFKEVMTINANRGWDDANTYLLLEEFNQGSMAKAYLGAKEELHNPERLADLINKCQELINDIKQQSCGPTDYLTADYCETLLTEIELHKDNYLVLAMHHTKMQAILQAVTSPEMVAVKEQITRLENMSPWFFGAGSHDKANLIKQTLSQVSLLERAHVFTDTQNPACNKVRAALASHRISWTNPLKEDNTIDEEQASKSFQDIARKFRA